MPLKHADGPSAASIRHPKSSLRAASWLAAAAVSLGSLAIANALLARRSEARRPPDGRFVTVDGVRLHYRQAGDGPVIVLLHGNGVSSDDFLVSGLLARLARIGRVIAFDRPGFGYSERPRRRDWSAAAQAQLFWKALGRLGVERPVVLGHSWGAFVAAEMALASPADLDGLVLVSGYYRPTARPDSLLMAGPTLPVIGDVLRYTLSPVAGRIMAPAILRHLFAPAPVTDRFQRLYPVSQSLRPSQLRASAAEAGAIMTAAARLAPRFPDLSTRTLVVAGQEDRLVDSEHQSAWLAGVLPDAVHLPVPGAGHMVHHTAPDALAEAIAAFMGRSSALSLQPEPAPEALI